MISKSERTLLTKEKLSDAFWQLYEKKPFDQITVREITELAGYNRSTFYMYYKDVYDILEQTETDIFSMIEERLPPQGYVFDKARVKDSIQFLGEFLGKNYKRLSLLLGENGDVKFLHRLLDQARKSMRSGLQEISDTDDKLLDYVIEYLLNAHIGLTMRWFKNDCDIPFEDLANLIYTITLSGILPVLASDEINLQENFINFK